MTKKQINLDVNQGSFDFDTPIEAYSRLRHEILNAPPPAAAAESYDEIAIELAAVLKATIRDSGKKREKLVDEINEYFGRESRDKRKCLTIAMFNNYLSKPCQYPIPAILIIAIQHVCQSLKPTGYFAEIEGGKAITREEIRDLKMGKLDAAMKELQKLKKELMGGKR